MFGIGGGEFVLILIAGLILFGPGKLPELGRMLGKGLREFRKAQSMLSASLEESVKETPKKSKPVEKVEKIETTPEEKSEPKTSVDDVIKLAKENPIPGSEITNTVPENSGGGENKNEKISDDNSGVNADNVGNGGSNAAQNGDANGTSK